MDLFILCHDEADKSSIIANVILAPCSKLLVKENDMNLDTSLKSSDGNDDFSRLLTVAEAPDVTRVAEWLDLGVKFDAIITSLI
jgi:hypothetical protein